MLQALAESVALKVVSFPSGEEILGLSWKDKSQRRQSKALN